VIYCACLVIYNCACLMIYCACHKIYCACLSMHCKLTLNSTRSQVKRLYTENLTTNRLAKRRANILNRPRFWYMYGPVQTKTTEYGKCGSVTVVWDCAATVG